METYHKIQTLFCRDLDGSRTGQKGKMIEGEWTTPELEYLANNEWEFTEKVDGTNIRVICDWNMGGQSISFWGRTDNATIPNPLNEYLREKFRGSLFDNANLHNIHLFGEGYGPKIQGGGKYRDDHSFVLFDVKIDSWWLNRSDVNDIADKLGIDSVPVIGTGTLYDAIDIVKSGLKSQWGDFFAEGIVARPNVPMFNRKGERVITKIKHVDFK